MLSLDNKTFLNTVSTDWNFDENDSQKIAKDLIDIMIVNKGIGLAANQVGLDKRILAIGSEHMKFFKDPTVIFNPKILSVNETSSLYKEGCLSFPDLWIDIKRPEKISVEYYDYQGNKQFADLEDLDARCFQHEYDHLDGICFIDKVSKLKLQLAIKKMRKNKK
jgi:peptide deformylase